MHINMRTAAFNFAVIFVAAFSFIMGANSANEKIEPEDATWNETVTATTETVISSKPIYTIDILTASEPITRELVYPLTEEEIELIALVTMAEAEGETELGKRLVIDTILNRVDNPHFPDNVTDVIYQPNQFSAMWNGRIDRCYIMPEIVDLVKEELLERTNYDCVFFMAGGYSRYGKAMFQECCHYFSSYE